MELVMLRLRFQTSRKGSLAAVTCGVLWLLTASSIGAQEVVQPSAVLQTGVEFLTPLMTFFATPKRSADVTVTELGPRGVTSTVRIVVYGPEDQVVAKFQDTLQRGHPVLFSLPLDPSMPRKLRFSIQSIGVAGRPSQPAWALEDVDGLNFTIGDRIYCAQSQPADQKGPVTPLCPDVVTRSFTTGG
jgi:hypothetical protein